MSDSMYAQWEKVFSKRILISRSDAFYGEQLEGNNGRSSNICRWKCDLQYAQFTFVICKCPEFQIQSIADCCHSDLSSRCVVRETHAVKSTT